jgi:hypothetical protein
MKDMPIGSAKFKREFCLEGNSKCARFMVLETLGQKHVPTTLFPNQHDDAIKIIEEKDIF